MINYYKVLGVEKSATKDQIRKMYKIQAIKTHPDKGGDKEKFQKIVQAYEILSDEEKRREYDHRLETRSYVSYSFFRNEVWLTIEQLIEGATLNLAVRFQTFVDEFGDPIAFDRCVRKCFLHISSKPCITCKGSGYMVDSEVKATEGVKQRILTINPRHGIHHNKKELIDDFMVVYKILPHKDYKIVGQHNLYVEKSIHFFHALMGQAIELPRLGKRIIVEFNEPIHEKEYRIRFRGIWSAPTTRGDIICKINFIMPELTDEVKKTLRECYNHLIDEIPEYSPEDVSLFKESNM